ncbi:LysR family transcriptional regulator [Lactobacillus sp.]|uniref:LysR family transcriptional regulator n=1 Tax=Lactobacillus sp. TaxID=1591 RepID=UPI003EF42EF1
MNFDNLKCFCAVVEAGSFKKAAENEFVSQRAISQKIQKLEAELGIKLFKRGKNKIEITPVGQQFYLQVSDMLAKFQIDVNALRYQQKEAALQLTVGYFSPFEGSLLKNTLYQYRLRNPKLELKITHEGVNHLVADVQHGLVDIAAILDYGDGLKDLSSEIGFKDVYAADMLMGVSKASQWANLPAFPIKEAVKKPVLYYTSEDSHYLREAFLSTLPEGLEGIRCARIAHIEQMQMLVAMDQAIAFYPGKLYQQFLNEQDLINYLPITGTASQDYRIKFIYSKNSPKLTLIQDVLQ